MNNEATTQEVEDKIRYSLKNLATALGYSNPSTEYTDLVARFGEYKSPKPYSGLKETLTPEEKTKLFTSPLPDSISASPKVTRTPFLKMHELEAEIVILKNKLKIKEDKLNELKTKYLSTQSTSE